MFKFEYKYEHRNHSVEIEEVLNRFGQDGWRVVTFEDSENGYYFLLEKMSEDRGGLGR